MSLPAPITSAPDEPGPVLPDLAAFRRPRLRAGTPLLWRDADTIQIGDDVVVDRITRSHVAWLTSLDGLQGPATIEDSLTIPEHEARRLVRALLAAGALEDAAFIPDAQRWASPVERDTVAARFSVALGQFRDLASTVSATRRREAARIGVVGDGPLGAAVADALVAAGLARDDRHPSVVVLADSPHPDVTAHLDHPQHERPHLHVGVLGTRAVVGPMVLPGRTSCLRCAHLHRRDADPAWPLLAVQWAQAVAVMPVRPVDPLLALAAGVQAALLVRLMLDHPDDPDLWSGHCLELALPRAEPVRRERPPHPLCGCQWARD